MSLQTFSQICCSFSSWQLGLYFLFLVIFAIQTSQSIGSGEAGKSTLLKQLRLLHTSGFAKAERSSYIKIARTNIIAGLQAILRAAQLRALDFGSLAVYCSYLFDAHSKSVAEELAVVNLRQAKLDDYVTDVKSLLESDPVRQILADAASFPIPDAAP